jgi:hypothetical protein
MAIDLSKRHSGLHNGPQEKKAQPPTEIIDAQRVMRRPAPSLARAFRLYRRELAQNLHQNLGAKRQRELNIEALI